MDIEVTESHPRAEKKKGNCATASREVEVCPRIE